MDEKTLGFADFGGNRQYISTGNLTENPKAFIFLMDYVDARRIKLRGRARIVENDAALLARLGDPAYTGAVERAVRAVMCSCVIRRSGVASVALDAWRPAPRVLGGVLAEECQRLRLE